MESRQRFVVVAERGIERKVFGPYTTFKKAEGAARSWDKHKGWSLSVDPIERPDVKLEEDR
jgi:hypothetical protein